MMEHMGPLIIASDDLPQNAGSAYVTVLQKSADEELLLFRSCPVSSSMYECGSLMTLSVISTPARVTRSRFASAIRREARVGIEPTARRYKGRALPLSERAMSILTSSHRWCASPLRQRSIPSLSAMTLDLRILLRMHCFFVRLVRFELTTSASQGRRATKLRYSLLRGCP